MVKPGTTVSMLCDLRMCGFMVNGKAYLVGGTA